MKTLKHTLGANGSIHLNKKLISILGYEATALLQHLIDLDTSFFHNTEFYQQSSRLENDLHLTKYKIRKAKNLLIKYDLISVVVKGLPPKSYFTIHSNNIVSLMDDLTEKHTPRHVSIISKEIEPFKGENLYRCRLKNLTAKTKNKETKNKETNNLIGGSPDNITIDEKACSEQDTIISQSNDHKDSQEEMKTKIFWKAITPNYPVNKLGNRQHALKQFLKLDTEEVKLAVTNMNRYLKAAGDPQFVKQLINYIEQRVFNEEWLTLQEEQNKPRKLNHNETGFNKTISTQF